MRVISHEHAKYLCFNLIWQSRDLESNVGNRLLTCSNANETESQTGQRVLGDKSVVTVILCTYYRCHYQALVTLKAT